MTARRGQTPPISQRTPLAVAVTGLLIALVATAVVGAAGVAGLALAAGGLGWAHHLGPARLVFTQRSDEGRQARVAAAADDGGYETVVRDIWV